MQLPAGSDTLFSSVQGRASAVIKRRSTCLLSLSLFYLHGSFNLVIGFLEEDFEIT